MTEYVPAYPVPRGYSQLHSGLYINLLDPDPTSIDAPTIAQALSKLCRFGGHTEHFYSVAQHCCLCCDNADDDNKWNALMHDASEAFLGDIPSPLKSLLPDYQKLEQMWHELLGRLLSYEINDQVREVDLAALATERRDLLKHTPDRWEVLDGVNRWPQRIEPWTPERAYKEFIDRVAKNHPNSVKVYLYD